VMSFVLDGVVVIISGLLAAVAFAVLHRSACAAEARARDLEQFAERVAHDIRGPLSPMLMLLEHVRRSGGSSEALQKTLARAENGVRHVTAMIDDLLAFARAGGVPRPDARAPVAPAVQGTFDEAAEFAQQNRVELRAQVAGDLGVACAPGVLDSILSNLVRNAIKYMGNAPERRVSVRAFAARRVVRIEVADTGPGLAPDAAECVFQPYVRANATGGAGFGLGLATVRRLADAHSGRVGVDSSSSGATFWVELPSA
jgi:signal transduction histidine kinase